MEDDTEITSSGTLYKDMSYDEIMITENRMKSFRAYNTNMVNLSSNLIFSWLFILNSGGLLALSSLFRKTPSCISWIIFLSFFLGVILVVLAIVCQWYRFSSIVKKIDVNVIEFRESNRSSASLLKSKYENKGFEGAVNILNIFSGILFIVGVFFLYIYNI